MAEIIDFDARPTAIDGLLLLTMKQVVDERGTVREFYRESALAGAGLPALGPWRQVNVTHTRQGALRGMHAEDDGEAGGAWSPARPSPPTSTCGPSSGTYGKVVTTTLAPGRPGARARRAWATGSRPPPRAAASTCTASTTSGRPAWPGSRARRSIPALGIDWPLADRSRRPVAGVGQGPRRTPVQRARKDATR